MPGTEDHIRHRCQNSFWYRWLTWVWSVSDWSNLICKSRAEVFQWLEMVLWNVALTGKTVMIKKQSGIFLKKTATGSLHLLYVLHCMSQRVVFLLALLPHQALFPPPHPCSMKRADRLWDNRTLNETLGLIYISVVFGGGMSLSQEDGIITPVDSC